MKIKSFTKRIMCPLQSLPNLDLLVVNTCDKLNHSDWEAIAKTKSKFLSISYLKAIENGMKENLDFRYVLFYLNKQPIGISVFQIKILDRKLMKSDNELSKAMEFGLKLIDHSKINLLVVGSMFNAGSVNYAFDEKYVDQNSIIELMNEAIKVLVNESDTKSINAILLKEFELKELNISTKYKDYSFSEFCLEPNMTLDIKENWKTFDLYLQDMTAKFRNKSTATEKKSNDIVSKQLSAEEIEEIQAEANPLFDQVYVNAKVKFGKLDFETFSLLKTELKDDFVFTGYWLKDKLIGFSTAVVDYNEMQANYIGLDYDYIRSHAIYQRILYDYVRLAISKKVKTLNLGRTSGEIKSTIGAKSKESVCYIRMKNTWSNHILKPMVKAMKNPEFSERDPFKKKK